MTRLAAFVAPRTLAAVAARTFASRNALNMPCKARALSSGSRNDPAIMAAIDMEREKRLAAKPQKFERSLTETLSDHRDALLNIVLAALLVILTLKMLREKVLSPHKPPLPLLDPFFEREIAACAPHSPPGPATQLEDEWARGLDRIRPLSRVSLWNEQGEKLDIESEREKRIKILEAELASLEFAVVESVRTVIPRLCH